MSLGEAIGDADQILTPFILVAAMIGVMLLAGKIGNLNFDWINAFGSLMGALAYDIVLSIRAIVVVGLILWIVRIG